MGVGRVICVALPFALTVCSIIALLVATLAGITDKSLYVFKVNTTDFSISVSDISSLLSSRSEPLLNLETRDDLTSTLQSAGDALQNAGSSASDAASDAASEVESAISGTNITAADLALADAYLVTIWNYCSVSNNGTKSCSKPAYNWADNSTSTFEKNLNTTAEALGSSVTIPDSVKEAMSAFSTVVRWAQIVFIIAFISLGVELFFGIFASCSRAISCCTWIFACFATIAVGAAAGLSTAMASIVVGAVDATGGAYGVHGSFNTRFLSTVWLAFAFALAASLTWIFTVCCCAPDHNKSRGRHSNPAMRQKDFADDESVVASAGGGRGYARLSEPTGHNAAYSGADYGHHHDTSYQSGGAAADYYNGNNATGANRPGYEPMRHQQV